MQPAADRTKTTNCEHFDRMTKQEWTQHQSRKHAKYLETHCKILRHCRGLIDSGTTSLVCARLLSRSTRRLFPSRSGALPTGPISDVLNPFPPFLLLLLPVIHTDIIWTIISWSASLRSLDGEKSKSTSDLCIGLHSIRITHHNLAGCRLRRNP